MGLLDLFRKPPPVRTIDDLADYLDSRASFLVQKCVYEYSRARAGILWQKLFKEAGFRKAVKASSWQNYEIGLGNVALMVDATLRAHAGAGRTGDAEAARTLAQVEGLAGGSLADVRRIVAALAPG